MLAADAVSHSAPLQACLVSVVPPIMFTAVSQRRHSYISEVKAFYFTSGNASHEIFMFSFLGLNDFAVHE